MNIGENMERVDGREKVTGATQFVADLKVKGMLHGATVRAPIAAGTITRLVLSPDYDWSGITVVTPADIPGRNVVHIIRDDMPCLAEREINYLGEPVALVCAETAEHAKVAVAKIIVDVGQPSRERERAEEQSPLLGIEEIVRRYKRNLAGFKSTRVPHRSGPAFPPFEKGGAGGDFLGKVPSSAHVADRDLNNTCRKTSAPLTFFYEPSIVKGDVEKSFHDADLVVESEYFTGFQEHVYLEPQGVIAIPHKDGSIRIIGSLQCPYYVRSAVAGILGLPPEEVIVEQAPTGGAFGGKEDFPSLLAAHASLLAMKSRKPVRIVYDRQEDISFTTKRHPSWVRHKAGVMRDGRIVALESDVLFDAGAYTTLSPVVLARGVLHACGAYNIPTVKLTAKAVKSNVPPCGAFRGFGVPQTIFAIESHMDTIARRLNFSPLELRRKNIIRPGDSMSTGQVLTESVGASACLEAVVKACDYEKLRAEMGVGRSTSSPSANEPCRDKLAPSTSSGQALSLSKGEGAVTYSSDERGRSLTLAARKKHLPHGMKRRGIGLSCFLHGATFTGSGELTLKARAALKLMPTGEVEILAGTTEMGQGLRTTLIQLAAHYLGISTGRVKYNLPDTSIVPDSGPTVASRSTMIVGRILAVCSNELLARMSAALADNSDMSVVTEKSCCASREASDENPPLPLLFQRGGESKGEGFRLPRSGKFVSWEKAAALVCRGRPLVIEKPYDLPPDQKWDETTFKGAAYPVYSWGAAAVEIEIDMETFETTPLKLWLAYEIGKALNPLTARGQLEGGSIQALGYGLMESLDLTKDGRFLQNKLQTYMIPTAADVPEIRLQVLEMPYSRGPCGAKGIGELPHNGIAPALRNAVLNALGVETNSIPVTPERIHECWEPDKTPS